MLKLKKILLSVLFSLSLSVHSSFISTIFTPVKNINFTDLKSKSIKNPVLTTAICAGVVALGSGIYSLFASDSVEKIENKITVKDIIIYSQNLQQLITGLRKFGYTSLDVSKVDFDDLSFELNDGQRSFVLGCLSSGRVSSKLV